MIQYDFKPDNKYRNRSGKNSGFPLLRILLVCLMVWGGYRWWQQSEDASTESPEKPKKAATPVQKGAKSSDYSEFVLENGNRQVSMVLYSGMSDSLLDTLKGMAGFVAHTELLKAGKRKILDLVHNKNGTLSRFRVHRGDIVQDFFRKSDSSGVYFVDSSGCSWNRLCFSSPLAHAAIELDSLFDFSGRERLQYYDKFIGLGESPVRATEKGIVLAGGTDSASGLRMIRLYHGKNTEALYKGLAVTTSLETGDTVQKGEVLGRLSPRDSSSLYLQMLRNGRFLRFQKLMEESYPLL